MGSGTPPTVEDLKAVRRGQLVYVNFDPVIGKEMPKDDRPAIVVGADTVNGNERRAMLIIVPLSRVKNGKTWVHQVLVPRGTAGIGDDSNACPDHVRSISWERVTGIKGTMPANIMNALDSKLRSVLGLL